MVLGGGSKRGFRGVLGVHEFWRGLHQVPKLKNLNLNFLDLLGGGRERGTTDGCPSDLYYLLVADKN